MDALGPGGHSRCVPTVDIAGVTISYAHAGSGPPLVLLHGGLSDRREWREQLAAFSDGFSVYAWDAPGCGLSDDPPESWRMPDFAEAVVAWLSALGVRRPHLLGLSWGSTLALEVYRRQPDLASLILCGAYAGWGGSLSAQETEARLQAFMAELALPPEQFVPTYIPTMVTAAAPAHVVEQMTAVMCDLRASGARTMLKAMAEADLRDVLPTIEVPTLLIYGEHDVRAPMEVAQQMHRAIAGSCLVLIHGAGHCCNAEAPEAFNAAVRAFLHSLA